MKTRQNRRTTKLDLECLEDRRLLSINPWVENPTLKLVVDSNDASDWARVAYTSTGKVQVLDQDGDVIKILYNGSRVSSVSASAVSAEILFRGEGGNDYFDNDTAIRTQAWGGTGRDTLMGGTGNDYINGGAGDYDDSLVGSSGNDTIYGGDGEDTIYGGSGNDWIAGEWGRDRLDGESGNDTVYGGTNHDTLYGGSGNDSLFGEGGDDELYGSTGDDWVYGGDGNDTLNGWDGDDFLFGSDGHDRLYGGEDDDRLFGDAGNDSLYGYTGNDALYGHDGNDYLDGGDGMDGLSGGNGVDEVIGGTGADRFLTSIGEEDQIAYVSSIDGIVRFGGPKLWSYSDVERMDLGLSRLHLRTSSTQLFKDHTFQRDDVDPNNSKNVGRNHGDKKITLYDVLFAGSNNWVATITIHELAHSWQNQPDFIALSGWRSDLGAGEEGDEKEKDGKNYIKAKSGNWWYLESADFVTDYAQTSPGEDFADTLAAVVMGNDFSRNSNDTPNAPTAKRAWINSWLNSI
jgi:hypothetical protein